MDRAFLVKIRVPQNKREEMVHVYLTIAPSERAAASIVWNTIGPFVNASVSVSPLEGATLRFATYKQPIPDSGKAEEIRANIRQNIVPRTVSKRGRPLAKRTTSRR